MEGLRVQIELIAATFEKFFKQQVNLRLLLAD